MKPKLIISPYPLPNGKSNKDIFWVLQCCITYLRLNNQHKKAEALKKSITTNTENKDYNGLLQELQSHFEFEFK